MSLHFNTGHGWHFQERAEEMEGPAPGARRLLRSASLANAPVSLSPSSRRQLSSAADGQAAQVAAEAEVSASAEMAALAAEDLQASNRSSTPHRTPHEAARRTQR